MGSDARHSRAPAKFVKHLINLGFASFLDGRVGREVAPAAGVNLNDDLSGNDDVRTVTEIEERIKQAEPQNGYDILRSREPYEHRR